MRASIFCKLDFGKLTGEVARQATQRPVLILNLFYR
jgi:hypothetical protein